MSQTIQSLNVKLSFIDDFTEGLGKMERKMQRSARNLSRLGNDLSTAFTLPLAGMGFAALKAANDFEQFEASFATMLGSAEKGKKLFKELADFTAKTPFELTEVSESAKRLLAFGIEADKINDTLTMLGDIAAGSGANIAELSRIFGQSKAVGKVLTADLRELANRGIPIFDALKERFGLTGDELRKFVEKGNVDFETLQDTLKGMTQEGGIFFGGMGRQAQTLGGIFSTFKDNVTLGLAEFGTEMVRVFDLKGKMVTFGEWVGKMVERFQNLDDGTKKTILTTAALVAALGPAIKIFAAVQGTIAQGIGMVKGMAENMKALGGAVLVAANSFKKLDMASKLTVIGLAAAAITGLVIAYQKWNSELSLNEKIQRNTVEVGRMAEEAIIREKLEAKQLIDVLSDENAKRADKEKALKRLNEISPEYFSGLQLENLNVEKLNKSYDAYVANLLKAARARAAQEKIIELEKERIRLLDRLEKSSEGFASIGEAWDVLMQGSGGRLKTTLEGQIKAIEEQQDALSKLAATVQEDFSPSSSGPSVMSSPVNMPKVDISSAVPKEKDTEAVGALAERFKGLNGELQLLPQNFSVISESVVPQLQIMTTEANNMAAAFTGIGSVIGQVAQTVGERMREMAAAGATSFAALGKAALKAAADVIRAKLMEFVSQVIASTGKASGPLALFLAPAAGAAAGIAFNKIIKGLKIPALAEGGMATGPTMAMVGEYPGASTGNPEVIAPLNKLKGMLGGERNNVHVTGDVRWNGREFVIGFMEAQRQFNRTGGF